MPTSLGHSAAGAYRWTRKMVRYASDAPCLRVGCCFHDAPKGIWCRGFTKAFTALRSRCAGHQEPAELLDPKVRQKRMSWKAPCFSCSLSACAMAHMWCAGTARSSLMTTPAVALVCGMQTQHSCITVHGKNLWFDRPSWPDAQWVTRTRSGCTQWSMRAPLPQVGGRLECSECGSACLQPEPTSLPPSRANRRVLR